MDKYYASFQAAKDICSHDGSPNTHFFINARGLRICVYKWGNIPDLSQPSGAVLLVHGITSHARSEFLHHVALTHMDTYWRHQVVQYYSKSTTQNEQGNNHKPSNSRKGDNSMVAVQPPVHGRNPSSITSEHKRDGSSQSFQIPGIRHMFFSRTGAAVLTDNTSESYHPSDQDAKDLQHIPFGVQTTLSTEMISPYRLRYRDSWVEAWERNAFVVYAVDLQGHGLSDGWKGQRCVFEAFDHVARDVVDAILYVRQDLKRAYPIIANELPLFCLGISLGGAAVARALELGCNSGAFGSSELAGAILLAPALGLDSQKKKCLNSLLLPFAGILSALIPRVRFFPPPRNAKYSYINQLGAFDPLMYRDRLCVRAVVELLHSIPRIHAEASRINSEIPVLICHSVDDQLCDPCGSDQFYHELPTVDKHFWLIHGMWHYLTKEPGSQDLLQHILQWSLARVSRPTE